MAASLDFSRFSPTPESDDASSDLDVELEDAVSRHRTTHYNAKPPGRIITMSSNATGEQGNHTSIARNGNKCPICNQSFQVRKTMLRHLRTVHAPKDIDCPSCNKKFIRQDNLNRHISEQHTSNDHLIACKFCNRQVSKRALPEHLESRICKASRDKVTAVSNEGRGQEYTGHENDCFLLTIRVLKIWLPLASGKQDQTSQAITSSEAYHQCCSLGARTLTLMNSRMQNKTACQSTLKLFCSAVLWAYMSVVGVNSGKDVPFAYRDWDTHLKGVAALLKVFHYSTCDCDKFLQCQQLRQRASRDPALSLLKTTVRDTGLIGPLLRCLPTFVNDWESSVRLLDALMQCLLNQIDQCGEEVAGRRSLWEAKGVECDYQRNRGLEAMIWAMTRTRTDDG